MTEPRWGDWDILGTQTEPLMRGHHVACVHTMVGSLAGTRAMFKAGGFAGTESHWGMGESEAQGVLQWQSILYSADANLDGWATVLSMETADYGGVFGTWDTSDAANVPAWTDWQCEKLAQWLEWVTRTSTHASCPPSARCFQEGIPLILIDDTTPDERGVGYHKQGCDPYRVSGGVKWSAAYGKGCPGPKRISQLPKIIDRAKQIRAGGGGEGDWFDMASKEDLAEVVAAQLNRGTGAGQPDWAATSKAILSTVQGNHNGITAVAASVDRIPVASTVIKLPDQSAQWLATELTSGVSYREWIESGEALTKLDLAGKYEEVPPEDPRWGFVNVNGHVPPGWPAEIG